MAAGRELARDEHRGQPRGGELPYRPARAREGDVGGAVGEPDLVHEGPQDVVGPRHALAQRRVIALAAQVEDGRAGGAPRLDRELVQEPRSERAAEDEDDGALRRQAELRPRCSTRRRPGAGRDRPADRLVLRAGTHGKREKDPLRKGRGEAVGEAEMSVRLGQRGRDAAQPRGEHHRAGDVAAAAEDDVRLPAIEDPQAGDRRRRRERDRAQLGRPEPAGEACDRELVERIPVLRNEPSLDAIRRPGERHRHSPLAQRFRHGERRGEMPHCSARGDQAPKLLVFRHGHERC